MKLSQADFFRFCVCKADFLCRFLTNIIRNEKSQKEQNFDNFVLNLANFMR